MLAVKALFLLVRKERLLLINEGCEGIGSAVRVLKSRNDTGFCRSK